MLKVGLEQNGWIVVKQPLNGNSSRFNLLATRRPLEEFSPRVLFNSHLDTVPPFIPPTEDSQNIYGRGACDAKGQIACMVTAAQALVNKHPKTARELALLFVVDEEVNHTGMQKANEFTALQPEYLVVGEPTELKFATIQKGALKVVVRCKGKAGHSGYPSEGESAIHKLIPVLNDLLNYAWPKDDTYGATTVNIGIMEGGQAQNAWAENAYARIFVRVTTSVADAQKRMFKWITMMYLRLGWLERRKVCVFGRVQVYVTDASRQSNTSGSVHARALVDSLLNGQDQTIHRVFFTVH